MGFHPPTALPEPVSIVYTFPCQSAGVPLSAFPLPLAAGVVNDRLKQTLFPRAGASVPWLWAASAPPGIMDVSVRFLHQAWQAFGGGGSKGD